MEEMLGKAGGSMPTEPLLRLYRHWARGGWGMLITGNVCIDSTHLGTPFDIALSDLDYTSKEVSSRFEAYCRAAKGIDQTPPVINPPLVVVQLVHAGRQSMRGSGRAPWKPALAPSAVPMTPSSATGLIGKTLDYILWGKPSEMTRDQIKHLVEQFVSAAELCSKTGFDGIELHASHGYQLAAFLSPRTNLRTDDYGRDAKGRTKLLFEIIEEIRKRVPKDFIIGVKLNSSDYIQGGLTEEDALLNVQWLAEHGGVDFVEISGGNYENAAFMTEEFDYEKETAKLSRDTTSSAIQTSKEMMQTKGSSSKRTKAREAFFQEFAKRARNSVQVANSKMVLIVTGGLRTRRGMYDAIQQGKVDSVGIARPACIYPDLPLTILNTSIPDDDERSSPPKYTVKGSSVIDWIPLQLAAPGWGT